MVEDGKNQETQAAERGIRSMLADLDDYRNLVTRHLASTKGLRVAYGELMLDFMKHADSAWLRFRHEALLAAFHSANNIDDLLLQRSERVLQPCERKRESGLGQPPAPVKVRPVIFTQRMRPTVGRPRGGAMSTRLMVNPYTRKGRTR